MCVCGASSASLLLIHAMFIAAGMWVCTFFSFGCTVFVWHTFATEKPKRFHPPSPSLSKPSFSPLLRIRDFLSRARACLPTIGREGGEGRSERRLACQDAGGKERERKRDDDGPRRISDNGSNGYPPYPSKSSIALNHSCRSPSERN